AVIDDFNSNAFNIANQCADFPGDFFKIAFFDVYLVLKNFFTITFIVNTESRKARSFWRESYGASRLGVFTHHNFTEVSAELDIVGESRKFYFLLDSHGKA